MRLIVTSDLHYNQAKSRPSADEVIARINAARADVIAVVGDTATADGDALEGCLGRFESRGPQLFVAGNHELWTSGPDSYRLYRDELPARVRTLGWHWLEGDPFMAGELAIVGNGGWYDYSFAQDSLGIPRRFYEHKISPGAAERFEEFGCLFETRDDIIPPAMQVVARWNDGRFVKLNRTDEQFLDEQLAILEADLQRAKDARRIIALVHQLPFRQLLPPPHSMQWDFAKAYLGSEKIGAMLLKYPNVTDVICGHSHFPAEAPIDHIRARSTGSGYRTKRFLVVEI